VDKSQASVARETPPMPDRNALRQGPSVSGGQSNVPTLQRSIGCYPTPGGEPQFQINAVRPALTGAAALMAPRANQERAHIIAFEVMQNDLANILNAMLAARGTAALGAQSQRLIDLCDALFVAANAEQLAMTVDRANLINCIGGLPAGALAHPQMSQLTDFAGTLLTALNSCRDNLRIGDRGANQSIGYSIDAAFLSGTWWYNGPVQSAHGAPAPAPAVPPGANVIPGFAGPPAGAGALPQIMVGPIECLLLTPADEVKVHAYQTHSHLALSFVTSGTSGGALFPYTVGLGGAGPGVAGAGPTVIGQHLSSTRMPSRAHDPPFPVLVRGNGVPFLFQ
jgi:hypothetical protein